MAKTFTFVALACAWLSISLRASARTLLERATPLPSQPISQTDPDARRGEEPSSSSQAIDASHQPHKRGLMMPTKLKIFKLHLHSPKMLSKMVKDPKGYAKHLDDVTRKSKQLSPHINYANIAPTFAAGKKSRYESYALLGKARVEPSSLYADPKLKLSSG
ncbi:hypothetical protein CBOM_02238 [Ceraceosorus bombacis]|uniref:Uncharacterized protein n=1 Tax=Ceraceosorus bombacis TaxID=401625 RepID=A0A0N7L9P8_9BASI|nr:hypothetical protein CBOM_02238 [Ceraceosorus bombacis]